MQNFLIMMKKYYFQQVPYIWDVFQAVPQKTYGLISGIKKAPQDKLKERNVPAKQGSAYEKKQDQQRNKDKFTDIEEVGKFSYSFNLEQDISKIKIHIPLSGIIINQSYREPTL